MSGRVRGDVDGIARAFCVVLATAVLSACVSVPTGKQVASGVLAGDAQAAAMARLREREMQFDATRTLAFSGRVALANGKEGGNGRLEWRQSGLRFDVTLSAPVTRQSWTLRGDRSTARIEGIRGGPRQGPDAEDLLREVTGLDIPVGALAAWAFGVRAPQTRFGVAQLAFTAEGELARIEQDGWIIDYLTWQDQAGADGQPLRLPARIDAHRSQAKVRLAIDDWSWPASPN